MILIGGEVVALQSIIHKLQMDLISPPFIADKSILEANTMNLIDPSLIKVGAVLKTRDGRKVRILATDIEDKNYKIAAGLTRDGSEEVICYTASGNFFADGNETEEDLISVWTEPVEWDWSATPPWLNWLAMDEDGEWILYNGEPEASNARWVGNGDIELTVPTAHSPKWTGCWKDSLTKRPV